MENVRDCAHRFAKSGAADRRRAPRVYAAGMACARPHEAASYGRDVDTAVAISIATGVITALSLLVAARALVYARRADTRAERADKRAEQADQRAERADQRAEQADQRAAQADHSAQEAQISANYLGYEELDGTEAQPMDLSDEEPAEVDWIALSDPERPRSTGTFRFRVTNVGPGGARHIRLRLIDATGSAVGASAQSPMSLAAGDSGEYAIMVAEPAESFAYPLEIRISWNHESEGTGERDHISQQEVSGPPRL
jgi:hypothetical protein